MDFERETEKSRVEINKWVSDNTENKISELIPTDGLDACTVMVLVNAVYFYGKWMNSFDKNLTQTGEFYVLKDKKIDVKMMSTEGSFMYGSIAKDESKNRQGVDLIKLPFKFGK